MRAADFVEHPVSSMVMQRVSGIAPGYAAVLDHDTLRHDPVLAGRSTLNRLEPCAIRGRYHRIGHGWRGDRAAAGGVVPRARAALVVPRARAALGEIVLDVDATNDRLHGHQEGRFFHGCYDSCCCSPLDAFCGRHLLAAKLRPANIDALAGTVEEPTRIVTQIRARWPAVRIILRADSGFARDAVMAWCEAHRVDFLLGLARNRRLVGRIAEPLAEAAGESLQTGRPARRFAGFAQARRDRWTRERRVIAKAEQTGDKCNPRFVVTTLPGEARQLYEEVYCARGEMDNRIKARGDIKARQLDLFADRTSAATMRANQLCDACAARS